MATITTKPTHLQTEHDKYMAKWRTLTHSIYKNPYDHTLRARLHQLQAENKHLIAGYAGEWIITQELLKLPHTYYLLNDLTINGHQIDHTLICPKGIFAIETKNYRGRYTYKDESTWLTKHGPIKNPGKQAKDNAQALSKYLNNIHVTPIIAMTNKYTLIGPPPPNMLHRHHLASAIRRLPDILTAAQIQTYVNKLLV